MYAQLHRNIAAAHTFAAQRATGSTFMQAGVSARARIAADTLVKRYPAGEVRQGAASGHVNPDAIARF